MTKKTHRNLTPNYQAAVTEQLARAGVPEETSEALLALDSAFFVWHRMKAKGELPGRLIKELGLPLEPSQFFALTAVMRVECGIGRDAPEHATVGLLAEELVIDPSRASRIASDLIAQGFLRREADQQDGRRTILRPTETAKEALSGFWALKWAKSLELFKDWEAEEILTFSRLFERYTHDLRRIYGLAAPDDPTA